MKHVSHRTCALLLALSVVGLVGCHSSQRDAEQYIKDSERQWAESVSGNDASILERILADDFICIFPDGRTLTKADAIADAKQGPGGFVSNHLDEVHVRFYGNTAVAQGSESWVKNSGPQLKGRFVWTDTWVRRSGRWQIVAAEDLIAPPLAP
jgi:ketosteroid isomerase-like protein